MELKRTIMKKCKIQKNGQYGEEHTAKHEELVTKVRVCVSCVSCVSYRHFLTPLLADRNTTPASGEC